MDIQSYEAGKKSIGAYHPDRQLLSCLPSFTDYLWLHSGTQNGPGPHQHGSLAGIGVLSEITISTPEELHKLDDFLKQYKGYWVFGHLSYESRILLETKLQSSAAHSSDRFNPISFFVPQFVLQKSAQSIEVLDQKSGELMNWSEWTSTFLQPETSTLNPAVFQETYHISLEEYTRQINNIIQHLKRGDIYEMNYCLPFSAEGVLYNPPEVWYQLQQEQQSPFAALYKRRDQWLLCTSPERWLTKQDDRLISQPIKGTARRDQHPEADQLIKEQLFSSEKEKAENVMIVDLVRNDLGRIACTGTVQVDELFGIYSFPSVHQMISTVSGKIPEKTPFTEILKSAFPMGSMTGAPKISAMQIITETETFSRGLYSGSVGYIDPAGNFDFNVVIRSILYNETTQKAVFPAGSAITVQCDPESEYKECLLKSNSMRKALGLPLQS